MQITWVAMATFPLLAAAASAPADPPVSRLGKQRQEVLICALCRQMKDILPLEQRACAGHLVKAHLGGRAAWQERTLDQKPSPSRCVIPRATSQGSSDAC